MPTGRVATVTPVAEETATGKVAAVYEDIRKTKGLDRVPNFWRMLATNPDHLELVWTRLKALMHPEAAGRASPLDPATREVIALAVSATNGCAYCVNSQGLYASVRHRPNSGDYQGDSPLTRPPLSAIVRPSQAGRRVGDQREPPREIPEAAERRRKCRGPGTLPPRAAACLDALEPSRRSDS